MLQIHAREPRGSVRGAHFELPVSCTCMHHIDKLDVYCIFGLVCRPKVKQLRFCGGRQWARQLPVAKPTVIGVLNDYYCMR
jgi:hypothetical protein